jgi:hypothetical protein
MIALIFRRAWSPLLIRTAADELAAVPASCRR